MLCLVFSFHTNLRSHLIIEYSNWRPLLFALGATFQRRIGLWPLHMEEGDCVCCLSLSSIGSTQPDSLARVTRRVGKTGVNFQCQQSHMKA
jgi:hypothetical protein